MEFGGTVFKKMRECKFVIIRIVKKMGVVENWAFLPELGG